MKFGVCIVSNYKGDGQQSMLRYADHLEAMLKERNIPVMGMSPGTVFGDLFHGKWKKFSGYIDKYVLFPLILCRQAYKLSGDSFPWIVHIVDHSNALYVPFIRGVPTVVTCHDVGAIKGARGELEDCPASFLGKFLQKMIMRGLIRAAFRVCVSDYTRNDFLRMVNADEKGRVRAGTSVILNPIRPENRSSFEKKGRFRLGDFFKDREIPRYLFHVGSNLRRKNREAIIEVFSEWRKQGDMLVFAGEKLSDALKARVEERGLSGEVIDLGAVDEETLAQLYQNAFAFLFPSRFEGFGWPIIEAQACGVPVLSADNSAIPEVCGGAALLRDSEDLDGFCEELEKLKDSAIRDQWIKKGYQNVKRFDALLFENAYLQLYEEMAAKHRN